MNKQEEDKLNKRKTSEAVRVTRRHTELTQNPNRRSAAKDPGAEDDLVAKKANAKNNPQGAKVQNQ